MLRIVLFGPQGSGKGTQGQLIEQRFNIPHISMGEILRTEVDSGSDLGKNISAIIASGELIDDDITNELVKNFIYGETPLEGFVLDGYPRRLYQAKFLDSIINIDVALELTLDDESAVDRLSTRWNCGKCGWVFNSNSNPTKQHGICDNCGDVLFQRDDDKPDAIKNRLALYRELSKDLRKFYTDKDIYRVVDATKPIEEVFENVVNTLALR